MKKNSSLGVIIILVGIFWLLSNLDVFSFSIIDVFFRSLAKLWPLLLIGLGINLLLKDNGVLKLLVWLIIIVSVMLYGLIIMNSDTLENGYLPPDYNYSESHEYSISKEPATAEGTFNLGFAAGEVRISSTNDNLMSLKSNVAGLKYNHRFEDDNRNVVIDFNKDNSFPFKANKGKLYCYFDLHKDIIWDLNLDFGATDCDLDLSDLAIKKLELVVGAAELDLRLGNKHSQTVINLNAGASDIEIFIPKDAGLKVSLDSALSANNLFGLDLEKKGDYYITPDFDSKSVKFIFNVDMGVGNLRFHPA